MILVGIHGSIFLQDKSDAFETFKSFKIMVEKEAGSQIKVLRTNRDGNTVHKNLLIFVKAMALKGN